MREADDTEVSRDAGHLDDVEDIAGKVLAAGGGRVAHSVAWLRTNESLLDAENVADWVTGPSANPGAEYHLTTIRSELASELWRRQLYIGTSVLDELLYLLIRSHSTQPISDLLNYLATSSLTRPSYILYPLHNLGVVGTGLIIDTVDNSTKGLAQAFGVAVSKQHNSMAGTLSWLQRVHEWFGVSEPVPERLVKHWHKSRSTDWLVNNPLLAVKVQSMRGDYYDNQRLLLDKLSVVTTFLGGLSVRQSPDMRTSGLFSSRNVNNWQTLDIHHYLIIDGECDEAGALTGSAVPMNVAASYLVEISDLPVELDVKHWSNETESAQSLWDTLNKVSSLQLLTRFCGAEARHARNKWALKLFRSFDFFRRSLHGDARWSATVSLAAALEMLLTSNYPRGGVSSLLRDRTEAILSGSADASALADAVHDVYTERSKIMHVGKGGMLDLRLAQRAYLDCLEIVVSRIDRVDRQDDNAMSTILAEFGQS